jgi:hypothetical protein
MKALLTAALLAATALPAAAFDPAKMNDVEKAAFGDAVREYLMANPSVLVEAINVLEERRVADESIAGSAAIPMAMSRWSSSLTIAAVTANRSIRSWNS